MSWLERGVIFIQPPQRCSRRWWESYRIHFSSRCFSCGSFWCFVLFWGIFLFWGGLINWFLVCPCLHLSFYSLFLLTMVSTAYGLESTLTVPWLFLSHAGLPASSWWCCAPQPWHQLWASERARTQVGSFYYFYRGLSTVWAAALMSLGTRGS